MELLGLLKLLHLLLWFNVGDVDGSLGFCGGWIRESYSEQDKTNIRVMSFEHLASVTENPSEIRVGSEGTPLPYHVHDNIYQVILLSVWTDTV